MKTKVNALMILALCGLLTGCNKAKTGIVEGSPYDGLNGRVAKLSYDSLAISGVGSLNYLKSSEAANAEHFANFVDGLVTHNDFGILVLNLAESASHNADYTEFTFKLRSDKNIVWSTYKGSAYKYNGQVQYVKASDFVTAAKIVCTYSTSSNTFYLIRDFVQGSLEYYLYTQILDGVAHNKSTKLNGERIKFKDLNTNEKKAAWIMEQMVKDYKNVYTAGGYDVSPVTAGDIDNIANGKRFGVVADDSTGKITYHLMNSALYFPTMLTYSCYLPVNENFYKEKGDKFGGSARDSILYNGPYILSKMDETKITYSKNKSYHEREDVKSRGFMQAHVDKVNYNLVKIDIDATYTRTQFENGNIDGFGLSTEDTIGWKKYIEGADGTGTFDNPASGLVNSRFLDTIGGCYGTNIVMERGADKKVNAFKSYTAGGVDAWKKYADSNYENYDLYKTYGDAILNTEKALRLQSVRKAIMGSFDYSTYYERYDTSAEEQDTVLQTQRSVHTYVPKNFVYDDNHNEYTETYYAAALAEKRGITLEEAQAAIVPGQYETRKKTADEVKALTDAAMADVALWNAANPTDQISLPIKIEYYSVWADQTSKLYDQKMIKSMNLRLNGITELPSDLNTLPYFKVVPTDGITTQNYNEASGQGGGGAAFDFAAVQWGWGADYGDPLTYMNTYTIGGDWGDIFNYINMEDVPNYKNNAGVLVKSNLLENYTKIVREGQDINDNLTERYSTFAEAEVELIEELAIYLPQTNDGQGWYFSVSKAAGYESPTANYGLSSDRLTGMWVLTEPLTREERVAIRAQQEAAKEAYVKNHPAIDIYGE